MEKIIFNDYMELVENMDSNTLVIAKYQDAINIISSLNLYGYDLFNIELSPIYEDEYYIEIDEDNCIWCLKGKAGVSEEYYYSIGDIAYIFGDCNSKIVKNIEYNDVVEVSVSDSEYSEYSDCSECCYKEECDEYMEEDDDCCEDDNGLDGFSIYFTDKYGNNNNVVFYSTDKDLVVKTLLKYL